MAATLSSARRPPRSFARIAGLVALLAGLVFIYVAFSAGSEDRALDRAGLVARGTVTEKRIDHVTRHRRIGGTEEQTLHVVHYRFTTRLGAAVDGEGAVGDALWLALQQDGPIAVRYLEDNPFVNRPDGEPGGTNRLYLVTGICLAGGGIIVLVARVFKGRRKARTGGE